MVYKIKVKKKPCTINLAQRRIQKDRDQSKYTKIENVTVKKTFAWTFTLFDQSMRKSSIWSTIRSKIRGSEKRVQNERKWPYISFLPSLSPTFCLHLMPIITHLSGVKLPNPGVGAGGGGTWASFCWVRTTGLSEPLLTEPLLGECNFRAPNLVTFCLCIYLIKPFNYNVGHPQFSNPPNPENVTSHSSNAKKERAPIIVNPAAKMRPHPAAHHHGH